MLENPQSQSYLFVIYFYADCNYSISVRWRILNSIFEYFEIIKKKMEHHHSQISHQIKINLK